MTRPGATRRAFLAPLCAAALLAPATPAAATVSEPTAESAAEVRDYWTAARMRAADPIDVPATEAPAADAGAAPRSPATLGASYVPPTGPARLVQGTPEARADEKRGLLPGDSRDEVTDPSLAEFRPHGKVFFSIASGPEAGDYVCSATAVNSKNKSVVWTAGHCVYPEGGSEFVSNWTFVPAYRDGVAPFGEWPAKRLATTGPWQGAGNIKYDLGAAVVRANAAGAKLQTVVGARGIGFDQPRSQTYQAFGYPAVQPPLEFTGEREFRCTSPLIGSDEPGTTGPATMVIDCDMTGGSSGGGWVTGTTLLSVTSYGYPLELNELYGPYMSSSAKALYKGVRGGKKKKPKGNGAPKGGKGGKGSK